MRSKISNKYDLAYILSSDDREWKEETHYISFYNIEILCIRVGLAPGTGLVINGSASMQEACIKLLHF